MTASENEEKAQRALGTKEKIKFKLVKSMQVTLEVDLVVDIEHYTLEEALDAFNSTGTNSLINKVRPVLDDLTGKSWGSTMDKKEIGVRKAIAKALSATKEEEVLCIGIDDGDTESGYN